MSLIRGDLKAGMPFEGPVALTIGNFDGVHLGHQQLLSQLIDLSKPRGLKTMVVTFDPHPDQVLAGSSFGYLSSLQERVELIKSCGIDQVFVQDFSQSFAKVTAQEFLNDYIEKVISPDLILFGYDFAFGRRGSGNFQTLKQFFNGTSVYVERAQPLRVDGQVISSSRIREFVVAGDLANVSKLLGRRFSIEGEIVKGDQIGRTLGFPTANLAGVMTVLPGFGVYAGRAEFEGEIKPAILNIGVRPTVKSTQNQLRTECHIIDFDGHLYGKTLKFYFIEKIRDEKKFSDLAALKAQIHKDIEVARTVLGSAF